MGSLLNTSRVGRLRRLLKRSPTGRLYGTGEEDLVRPSCARCCRYSLEYMDSKYYTSCPLKNNSTSPKPTSNNSPTSTKKDETKKKPTDGIGSEETLQSISIFLAITQSAQGDFTWSSSTNVDNLSLSLNESNLCKWLMECKEQCPQLLNSLPLHLRLDLNLKKPITTSRKNGRTNYEGVNK